MERGKHIYGLLIAAGESGRMKKFKPLMKYKGLPFIIQIIVKMFPVCEKIIVVTGFKSEELIKNAKEYLFRPEIISIHLEGKIIGLDKRDFAKNVEFLFNENYESGMFSSLKCGINFISASKPEWILYHFVDQPDLPAKFYYDFVSGIDQKFNWIQPRHKQKNGHPILINNSLFDLIGRKNNESSLRDISADKSLLKKYWDCAFPQVLTDLDTPEDVEKLGI